MSYGNPNRRLHIFSEANMDFSGNNASGTIRGPRGKRGYLKYCEFRASTTIAGTNNDAKINIGNGTSATAYMSWTIGEPAADATIVTDSSAQATNPITDPEIPADTDILVAVVEDTAGDGAGDGVLVVCIDWAD